MKRTIRVIFAALLLCTLFLTACSQTAQKDVPTGDPSEETQEPSGTPEVNDGQSAEQEDLPGSMPEGEDSPSLSDAPAAETDAPVVESSPVRLAETPDAGREYLDKLYFLGDSTTYWMGYYYDHGYAEDLIPSSHIWTGVTGTMTLAYYATTPIVYETGEQISIREAVERAKPEYLVITLGVNGVSFMDEEWFVRDYTDIVEIVKDASPETKIILNSIFPISTTYPHQKDVNNDKIRTANGWIEQIAADTGTRFLNSFESVVGEDGNLPASSTRGDGLHMNGDAFSKVMAYFRTHAYI